MHFENDTLVDDKNFYDYDYQPYDEKEYTDLKLFNSPKKIYDYLDSQVYSHTAYKKALSLFMWKHLHGHTSGALLVAGESGSGKTEMIRVLSKNYTNIHIADGASIVPNGYKGSSSLATQLTSLDFLCKECPPVLIIDEFDKLCMKATQAWSDTSLISELLKFIEGGTYNAGTSDKPKYVDTSGMAVILLGSYSSFTEPVTSHAIGFGASVLAETDSRTVLKREQILAQMPPELQGRISHVVVLDSFTEDDYYSILKDDRYSPVARLSKEYHLNLSISDKKYREIAHEAFISRTGVRRMNNAVSAYLDEHLFINPKVKEICIE